MIAVAVPSLLLIIFTLTTGISPMPSSRQQRDAIVAAIPADTTGAIAELGAGWGTLTFAIARRFPHCTVTAYELSPVPWLFLHLRRALTRTTNVTIRRQSFLRVSLADVDVMVSYLFRDGMRRIGDQLEREGKPGALLISHTFAVWAWKPTEVRTLPDFHRTPVYLYRLPPTKVAPTS